MAATLVGYDPTPGNSTKLISLTHEEEVAAKAALRTTSPAAPYVCRLVCVDVLEIPSPVVRAEEKPTAFLELESAIHARGELV